jgi:membrane-associated phospholipid phosphatase
MGFRWKKQTPDTRQESSSTSDIGAIREGFDWTLWPPVVALLLLSAALIPTWAFNVPVFSVINGLHTPLTDELWLCFTTLGDGLLLSIIVGAFLVVNPRVTVMGLLLLLVSSIAVHSLKAGFPLPRPAATLASVHIVGPLLRAGSFPSGHTAAAMSAALAIAYYSPSKKTAAVALAMALLVSVSRIFVGAHFPMDVVGGMACALGAYVFVRNVIWPRVEEFIPDRPRLWSTQFRVALIAECIATLFAITVYPTRFAESPAFAVTVGIAVLGFLVFGLMQASTRPTL